MTSILVPDKLKNPLNAYNSYSTSFDLIITNNLQVIQSLKSATCFDRFVSLSNADFSTYATINGIPDENKKQLRRTPRPVYDDGGNSVGDAIHLINSTVDADFLIQRFESLLIMNPNQSSGSSIGIQLTASMSIHEPNSATFMDMLNQMTFNMNTTDQAQYRGVFFAIRPVAYPNSTQPDTNVDDLEKYVMSVFVGTMTELSCGFSTMGTDYEISIVGVSNGTSSLPHNNTIAHITKLKLDPNMTLSQALKRLELSLNETNEKSLPSTGDNNKFVSYQYEFNIDPIYLNADYAIDNVSSMSTQTGKNDPIMSFVNGNVTSAIMDVMMLSSRISYEADPLNSATDVYESTTEITPGEINAGVSVSELELMDIYKPTVVTQLIHNPLNASKPIQQFNIKRSKVKYTSNPTKDMSSVVQSLIDGKTENLMVYDYLHTGQNIDVLNAQLAVTNGLAYTTCVESNNIGSNGITYVYKEPEQVALGTDSMFIPNLVLPKMPSTISNTIVKNESQRKRTYDAIQKFYFPENMIFEIEVTGNPNLYNSYAAQRGLSINEDSDDYSNLIYKNIDVAPSFVFLNVMFPSSPNYWEPDAQSISETNRLVSIEDNKFKYNSPQLVPFWFRGIQQLMSISTIFEGATFKHQLYVYPLTTNKQQIEEENLSKKTQNVGGNNTLRSITQRVISNQTTNTSTSLPNSRNFAREDDLVPINGRSFKALQGTPMKNGNYITSAYSRSRITTYRDKKTGEKVTGPRPHKGTDLRGSPGTPVYCIADGEVLYNQQTGGAEVDIILVKHNTGHCSRYVHIKSDKSLKAGSVVSAGQQLGTIAIIPKDYQLGPHLHFEISYNGILYNPEQFITIIGAKPTSDVKLYFNDNSLIKW